MSEQLVPNAEPAVQQPEPAPAPEAPAQDTQNASPSGNEGEVNRFAKKFAESKQPKPAPEPVIENKWEPNYKFKVLKQDQELDEKYRGWIKDADSEKSVKELVSKSMAFDWMKDRHHELRENHNQVSEQHQALMGEVEQLKSAHQRGDYETFFQILNIPEQRVLQWVANRLQFQQLPPEQRAIYEARTKAEREAYSLQSENTRLQEQLQQEAVQARSFMLDTTLERPEVRSFADQFDTRVGRQGAFREEVISRGKMAYFTRGVDLAPEQAVQEVIDVLGGFQPQQAAPQGAPARQAAPMRNSAPAPQAAKAPIIPNVQGRASSSPAKDKPKSIDDLKKKYYEMSGQFPG